VLQREVDVVDLPVLGLAAQLPRERGRERMAAYECPRSVEVLAEVPRTTSERSCAAPP
jgi:hypothetical protein